MFENIINSLKIFDNDFTQILNHLLSSYQPYENPPFLAAQILIFTKIIVYSFFIFIPILILKVLFPEKRFVNLIIYAIIVVDGLSAFAIFLGFIQLLYTF